MAAKEGREGGGKTFAGGRARAPRFGGVGGRSKEAFPSRRTQSWVRTAPKLAAAAAPPRQGAGAGPHEGRGRREEYCCSNAPFVGRAAPRSSPAAKVAAISLSLLVDQTQK